MQYALQDSYFYKLKTKNFIFDNKHIDIAIQNVVSIQYTSHTRGKTIHQQIEMCANKIFGKPKHIVYIN